MKWEESTFTYAGDLSELATDFLEPQKRTFEGLPGEWLITRFTSEPPDLFSFTLDGEFGRGPCEIEMVGNGYPGGLMEITARCEQRDPRNPAQFRVYDGPIFHPGAGVRP